MRARLRENIRQSCDEMGVHIARGVLARDHVHMFLSIPPKLSLSVVVQRIKGRSSRRIPTDVPDDLLTVALLRSGFLSHLHSLVVAMSQKSSLIRSPKTVLLALTSDPSKGLRRLNCGSG